MYCENCGCKNNDNEKFCFQCGKELTSNVSHISQNVNAKGNIAIKSIDMSLFKYSWFAPVSVVISSLITFVLANFIYTPFLISDYVRNLDSHASTMIESIARTVWLLLYILIPLIVSYILYCLSTLEMDKASKKQVKIAIIVPVFLRLLVGDITDIIAMWGYNFHRWNDIKYAVCVIAFSLLGGALALVLVNNTFKTALNIK